MSKKSGKKKNPEWGERLREARKSTGLTLEQFASRIDEVLKKDQDHQTNPVQLCEWENSKHQPRLRYIKAYAKISGFTLDYLTDLTVPSPDLTLSDVDDMIADYPLKAFGKVTALVRFINMTADYRLESDGISYTLKRKDSNDVVDIEDGTLLFSLLENSVTSIVDYAFKQALTVRAEEQSEHNSDNEEKDH